MRDAAIQEQIQPRYAVIKRPEKSAADYIREHEIALLKLLIPKYSHESAEIVRRVVLDKQK